MPLTLILASATLTQAIPMCSDPISHLIPRDSPSANLACHPNNIAVDSTVFVDYASAFCANVTTAQQTSQVIALMSNHTLTIGVNPSADAIKCQVNPGDCAYAMQLIRKTCEYPFWCRVTLNFPFTTHRRIIIPSGRYTCFTCLTCPVSAISILICLSDSPSK